MIFQRPSIITDANVNVSRRSFLIGGGAAVALVAAPSVVRASSLMDIRGVPLRSWTEEFIPCHGQVLQELEAPDLFKAMRDMDNRLVPVFHDPATAPLLRGRQYGGTVQERTFAVPDFRGFADFDLGAKAAVNYELDRQGDLYLSVEPVDSMRDSVARELGYAFSDADVGALLSGKRVKL